MHFTVPYGLRYFAVDGTLQFIELYSLWYFKVSCNFLADYRTLQLTVLYSSWYLTVYGPLLTVYDAFTVYGTLQFMALNSVILYSLPHLADYGTLQLTVLNMLRYVTDLKIAVLCRLLLNS